MHSSKEETSDVKPFIIDLFDEEDPQETETHAETKETSIEATLVKQHDKPRFSKDVDTELRLSKVQEDLAKSNAEAKNRRIENKALKESVEAQQRELTAFKSRTVRTEARAALAEKGVVHKDVLDIFLKNAGESIKVDESFEVQGIEEAVEAFTKSHSVFFKQLQKEQQQEEEPEKTELSNKTSKGGSIKGATGDKTTVTRDPNDKRSADQILTDYKKTISRR